MAVAAAAAFSIVARSRRHRTPVLTAPSQADKCRTKGKLRRPGLWAQRKPRPNSCPPFKALLRNKFTFQGAKPSAKKAVAEILAAGIGGFDTEAKPTFRKGQKSDGPHVVQFALTDKAFIFQLHRSECEKATAELIASKRVLKVGFGLKNDHGQIRHRLGISLDHVLDLDQSFRKLGYRGQIGVRGAMGVLLKLSFKKSKFITTSNWALRELGSAQLRYAANDAYAALKIMEALQAKGHLE